MATQMFRACSSTLSIVNICKLLANYCQELLWDLFRPCCELFFYCQLCCMRMMPTIVMMIPITLCTVTASPSMAMLRIAVISG